MRIGSFSRQTMTYGPSLSVVKPSNNDPGSAIVPELLDPALALTDQQQQDLQARIDDLYAALRGERQLYA